MKILSRLVPAALAVAAAVLVAPAAEAKVPAIWNCNIPSMVLGCPSGTALRSCGPSGGAPATGVRLVVRDVNNVPLPYEEVVLDFSNSAIHLLGDERPGTTVNCAAHTITRFTDLYGVVVFAPRIVGPTAGATVAILADGVPIAMLPVLSTDLDGNGTTDIGDFVQVAANYLSSAPTPATDFDPCSPGSGGRTTLTDFVIFIEEYLRPSSGARCP